MSRGMMSLAARGWMGLAARGWMGFASLSPSYDGYCECEGQR
jgi:hypothetical protein